MREPVNESDSKEPNVDVHYSNGHLKFKINFKQHVFNWLIFISSLGCGAHGVWLHYHEADLESTIIQQQQLINDAQKREAVAAESLERAELLLERRSTIAPTSSADTQDTATRR